MPNVMAFSSGTSYFLDKGVAQCTVPSMSKRKVFASNRSMASLSRFDLVIIVSFSEMKGINLPQFLYMVFQFSIRVGLSCK